MAGCFRTIVCKGCADADAVVVTFFPAAEQANVRSFYDEEANPLWRQGREDGWLIGNLRRDFFEPTLYRGQVEGPPPRLAAGTGLTFCGHGLTVSYKTWASYFTSAGADEKHAKLQAVCCAPDSDSEEVARAREAARLRRDEAAKASEWSDEQGSSLVDDDMAMLKERLELQSSTERQLGEIKDMLRMMSSAVGVTFVDDKDQVTSSAYVFVALNVLIFFYAANVLLVQPILASVAVVGGSGSGSVGF